MFCWKATPIQRIFTNLKKLVKNSRNIKHFKTTGYELSVYDKKWQITHDTRAACRTPEN